MRAFAFSIILLSFGLLAANAGDPGKRRRAASVEDALPRAVRRAKTECDDQKLVRVTVHPPDKTEDPAFIVLCEMGTGDIGVFQGGEDEAHDQWILIEKKELDALQEVVARAKNR